MIVAIRGSVFNVYLKTGYNLVRRYQTGEAPDDKLDLFEHLGCYKELDTAKRLLQKQEGVVEIIKNPTSSGEI
tara:strand:- start:724 stop:942 length:219 start_codon:yes stop_codon:yes gene_type:complete